MRKFGTIIMVFVLTGILAGCGRDAVDSEKHKKSLYEHGLELVVLMEEMATNDSYLPLYSGNSELEEIVSVVGDGDYKQPKVVYKLTVNKDILHIMTEMQVENNLSEKLMDYVTARTYSTIATQINAQGGANTLAAASVCTAGKTFVNDELDSSTIYLYIYENGLPVMVTFTPGEDDTVSASGCFIFYDGFDGKNIDKIKELLEGIIDTIEEVNQ